MSIGKFKCIYCGRSDGTHETSCTVFLKDNPKNEQEIEQEINEKGLTAPRITPDDIDKVIKNEQYHAFSGTTLTVCALTLANGFVVTGESAAVSPENFDPEIGKKIARENARNKVRMLEGYLLKQRMYEDAQITEYESLDLN